MRVRVLTPATVPDGEYEGKMSGYEIEFAHDGKSLYVTSTTLGVRGLNVPVTFRIVDGQLVEGSITT